MDFKDVLGKDLVAFKASHFTRESVYDGPNGCQRVYGFGWIGLVREGVVPYQGG